MSEHGSARNIDGFDELPIHEKHFIEVVSEVGGVALLEMFNKAELTGEGSVASLTPDEMRAIAWHNDGRVHVQYLQGDSFNLPYARARELAAQVARTELQELASATSA